MLCLFCCMNGNGIGRVRFQEDFFPISEKFDSFCTLSFCCSEKSVSPNTTKKKGRVSKNSHFADAAVALSNSGLCAGLSAQRPAQPRIGKCHE